MKSIIQWGLWQRGLTLILLSLLSGMIHAANPPTILVFGDSLSAGFGLKAEQAWPVLLETELKRRGKNFTVVNASLSGETSAGGRSRFAAISKKYPAQLVIIALGANDGLRGLPTQELQNNLAQIISTAQAAGAKVHLVGMQMPPNYGLPYTKAFAATYPALAKQYKTSLTPFLLAPVIANNAFFQADQLHPIASAQPLIMQGVLQDLLTQQKALFK